MISQKAMIERAVNPCCDYFLETLSVISSRLVSVSCRVYIIVENIKIKSSLKTAKKQPTFSFSLGPALGTCCLFFLSPQKKKKKEREKASMMGNEQREEGEDEEEAIINPIEVLYYASPPRCLCYQSLRI